MYALDGHIDCVCVFIDMHDDTNACVRHCVRSALQGTSMSLYVLAGTPQGAAVLEDSLSDTLLQISALKRRESVSSAHRRSLHVLAASCLTLLRRYSEAAQQLLEALKTPNPAARGCSILGSIATSDDADDGMCDEEMRAWVSKLDAARRVQAAAVAANAALPSAVPVPPRAPDAVVRVHFSALTPSAFVERFSAARRPVIITGMLDVVTGGQPWTMAALKTRLAGVRATVKRTVEHSSSWARLDAAGVVALPEFIDAVAKGEHDGKYLHDWSLATHAPSLLAGFSVPRFFASDLLQTAAPGSLYRDSWPSLFIGAAGSRSPLHVDSFASHFWMLLTEGVKHVRCAAPVRLM